MLLWFIGETSIYSQEVIHLASLEDSSLSFDRSLGFFFCYKLANLGVSIVGKLGLSPIYNDFGLRLPFLLIHLANCLLLYKISLRILKKPKDALLCAGIFMLIPGISVGALVVSNISLLLFLTLFIIYVEERQRFLIYPAIACAVFLDAGASILCLGLFFYSLCYRHNWILVFSVVCFGINMYLFAPIFGVPKSYFLDTIGFLAIVFTPVLFIYYCAYLYSYTFHNPPSLLNLIAFIGFIFVLLLSTRQSIKADSFLPLLSVGLPIFVDKMMRELRVRLPQFRLKYRIRLVLVFLFLAIGNLVLFGNKLTYYFSSEHNFAYSFYEAKEIAKQLHDKGLVTIQVDGILGSRLAFYGIDTSPNPKAPKLIPSKNGEIRLIYGSFVLASYSVVKQ